MALAIRYARAARTELQDAVARYEAIETGLGRTFAVLVRSKVRMIARRPRAWPLVPGGDGRRRYVLKRFPFVIVYAELDTELRVIAVAHMSREPGYWRERR